MLDFLLNTRRTSSLLRVTCLCWCRQVNGILQIVEMSEYSEVSYWNERYSEDSEPFEWYMTSEQFCEVITPTINAIAAEQAKTTRADPWTRRRMRHEHTRNGFSAKRTSQSHDGDRLQLKRNSHSD